MPTITATFTRSGTVATNAIRYLKLSSAGDVTSTTTATITTVAGTDTVRATLATGVYQILIGDCPGWGTQASDYDGRIIAVSGNADLSTLTLYGDRHAADIAVRAKASIITSPAGRGIEAVMRRALRGVSIVALGDSTTAGNPSWPHTFAPLVAARNGTYSAHIRAFNDSTQKYDQPTVLSTGTAGERYTEFATGQMSYATTTQTVGDLDVRFKIRCTDYTSGAVQTIAAKYQATGNQRGWWVAIGSTGKIAIQWSANGTSTTVVQSDSAVPSVDGTDLVGRVTLDVDNGASGYTATFYTSDDDGETWTQFGNPVTGAGATSIFNSTADYSLGSHNTVSYSLPIAGRIYWCEIYSGLGTSGTPVCPFYPDQWEQASTLLGAPTVTHVGSPVVTIWQGAKGGQAISWLNDSDRRPKLIPPGPHELVVLCSSHNEGQPTMAVWRAALATWATDVASTAPNTPILAVAPNLVSTGEYAPTQSSVDARNARGGGLMLWAASRSGVSGIDLSPVLAEPAFMDSDGLHPSTLGYAAWGSALYDALFGS